jgi:uncharacterized membrane-anchored protein YjiN (DUF445 family)
MNKREKDGTMNRYVTDFLILPVIGAIHGYVTNKLAIWLLFNPKHPIRIPATGWQLQGVLPKRKTLLAESLSTIVESDLLSHEEIKKHIQEHELLPKFVPVILERIMERIDRQIPRWVPASVRTAVFELLSEVISRELGKLLHDLYEHAEQLQSMVPLRDIVRNRLLALDCHSSNGLVFTWDWGSD